MLPTSHEIPIKQTWSDSLSSPLLLAQAFSEFISASTQLESSYRDLQQEVSRLGSELASRNAALTRSLAENDRMRAALQQMLDSMPCGVLVVNYKAEIAMINPECRRLLELGDVTISDLRDLSRLSQVNFEALANAPDSGDREICLQSENAKRWLAIGNRKLRCESDSQSAPKQTSQLQSIWILRDITPNKLAELGREAARRAAVLAEISTILAHEIRNPLASMELFAGLIEQDGGNTAEWISHLRAGIRTLSGTVNNVLSLNGEARPQLVSLNLATCIQRGVDFVKPIANQAGVSLSYCAAGDTPTIEGNEDAIRQIILNIVCNAVRHTTAGGRVDVKIQMRSKRVFVVIADTGSGIPENVLAHVFDAGFSATGETPGLGLAVCKRLMMLHGGDIHVSSRIGEGSTFQLEFPTV